MIISDEYGKYPVMICDNRRGAKYTEFLERGNKVPEKNDILAVVGSKGADIVFADNLIPLNEKIYMKLSDLN